MRPLVDQSPHHIKNTQQFVDYIHKVKLEPGEVITSYNIKALYTSVPVEPSIAIVQQKITTGPSTVPKDQHVHPPNSQPFRVCLTNTYFLFQGKYYEQVHGATMGSPVSTLIDNLFMEELEVKAINSHPHPYTYGSGL